MPARYYHYTCKECNATQPIEANDSIDNPACLESLCFTCYKSKHNITSNSSYIERSED